MITYSNSVTLRNDGTDPSTNKKDLNAAITEPVEVTIAATPPGSGAVATIFDIAGAPLSNPFNTDNKGNYSFQAADGEYDITLKKGTGDETIIPAVSMISASAPNDRIIPFDTLDDAVNETNPIKAFNGAKAYLEERDDGNGGGAYWSFVLASSVTPNTHEIVQCVGVPTLALVLKPSNGTVSVEQVGDFVRACEYASENRLKCILESDITISGVKTGSLVTVSDYFDFDSNGNVITDDTVYTDGEFGVLFEAINCDPLIIKTKTVSQNAIDVGGAIEDVGWIVVQPKQGCNNIDLDLRIQGGMGGCIPTRLSSDPESYRVRNIKAYIKSNNTHYPYNAQFSGDNADIKIDADTCGRNYFLYGVDNNRIDVVSKNPQKTSFVAAFEGKGCSNITVKETDVTSSNCQSAANHTTLRFGDATPATLRNIEFIFNIINPVASWGNSFEISKFAAGVPDNVGRGHVLDGVRVTGLIDNTASGNSPITTLGTFTGPDVIDHFDFEYLNAPGGTSTLQLQALSNTASFKNLNSAGANFYVLTNDTSKTTFENVTAGNITSNIASTDSHIYTGCNITDGSTQNLDDNKTFVDCTVNGIERTVLKQNNIGLFTAQSSKVVSGSLAGPINLFKLQPVGAGYKMRLKYFLVGDQADTNPVTRDETIGTKVLTATMNSGGAWVQQIAPADEVTELSQGTATALNVSLVNGDATGSFIAIDAPSYTIANSRGVFQLEVLSYIPVTIIPV